LKSGQNSPDRKDYIFAERENYAQFARVRKPPTKK
jgi:hypothetical protein